MNEPSDPRPSDHPAGPGSDDPAVPEQASATDRPVWYSPPPEPTPGWVRAETDWNEAQRGPGTGLDAPTRSYGTAWPTAPVTRTTEPRRTATLGQVFLVGLLAALLASGGTVLGLQAVGVLDRQVTGSGSGIVGQPASQRVPTASNGPQSVTISEQSAITNAAQKTGPAIVTIHIRGRTESPLGDQLVEGVGSGIIYDSDGWILTNRHVVSSANTDLQVELTDGRDFAGTVYGIDTLTDLAIVKIDGRDLPVAPIGDSSNLKAGQLAIAIGSPLGEFTNTVTSGVISALGRDIEVNDEQTGQPRPLRNLIQTDAAINPGNSGGALLDSGGNVIGVNTAVASSAQGIGFAIPIDIAKPIMRQALDGQKLARPWIGIYYDVITPEIAKTDDLPIDYGARVSRGEGANGPAVVPDSPADKAGVKTGDIITSVDGRRIDSKQALDDILTEYEPGDTVTLEVLREGQTLELDVKLGTRPSDL
jgi:serine protease Do